MENKVYVVEKFNILSIASDPAAQRPINGTKVDKLVSNFSADLLEPITLSKRSDGTFHIIDGQHRVRACRLKSITTIPARIIEGLTLQQESELFLELDKCKTKVSAIDNFRVSIKAGNTEATAINTVIERNGFHVVGNRRRSMNIGITAVASVKRIVKNYGINTFDKSLGLISNVWSNNPYAIQHQFIEGVTKFLDKYSGKPNFNPQNAYTKLLTVNPQVTIAQARGKVHCSAPDAVVETLVNAYNYRLTGKRRIG